MKPITEYIQKKHISNTIKTGKTTIHKLVDGDYFVLDIVANWKDCYAAPYMAGKFKEVSSKYHSMQVMNTYFVLSFGTGDAQNVSVNTSCGIQGCELRYATKEEIEDLQVIENKIQHYIDDNKEHDNIAKYYFKEKTIELEKI